MMERMIANLKKQRENAPKTLAEAHERLEQTLSAAVLAEIDAMPSEDDMIKYHFSLGLNMRNGWGLWGDSPLAKHIRELGFVHPDTMSGVILETFWCKRHGQDLRLAERAAKYKEYRDAEKNRVQESIAAIRDMMMGVRFEKQDVPVVRMSIKRGMSARYLSPFRDGVFLTGYRRGRNAGSSRFGRITEGFHVDPADGERRLKPEYDDAVSRGSYYDPVDREDRKMQPGDDFYTVGYYFDPTDRKIHQIRVAEVNEVYTAAVVGKTAWFAGVTDEKAVLVGVSEQGRITARLPVADEIPDLGLDGQSLLAVYSKAIYRLTDREWTVVHSGDILLPRSGLPPQRHGNVVFFRDEEPREMRRRLWWLTMGEKLHLSVLDRDLGLVLPDGTTWPDASSYCVTSSGDLWVCVGQGTSLLRRSRDGSYSIAIMDKSVRFEEDLSGSGKTDQGLSVSAVATLPDDTLLLVGRTGLHRLRDNELVQELAFAPEETVDRRGRAVRRLNWHPHNVLLLDDGSYFISTGFWEGVYWLGRGDDGQWGSECVERGDPVVW